MLPDLNSLHVLLELEDTEHTQSHDWRYEVLVNGDAMIYCRRCDGFVALPLEYHGLCLCTRHKCDSNASLGSAFCDSCVNNFCNEEGIG